jgi:hypothetical protein
MRQTHSLCTTTTVQIIEYWLSVWIRSLWARHCDAGGGAYASTLRQCRRPMQEQWQVWRLVTHTLVSERYYVSGL